MNPLYMLAQSTPNFWRRPPTSPELFMMIAITFVLAAALVFGLSFTPPHLRRKVVWFFTFLGGIVFVGQFIWPKPIKADIANEIARSPSEGIGFFLGAAVDPVATVANVMAAFLLGLGIYSLMRVHLNRLRRKQENWGFSLVLVISFLAMLSVAAIDWIQRQQDSAGKLNLIENWTPINYATDLLFDGVLQQMEAAMFSIIAFFILSAAFRAFRIRSVEATVMMVSALILMLNLMGMLTFSWGQGIDHLINVTGNPFFNNLNITVIADWVRSTMQTPAIRAIEFGVGLGALAMGLRIWLGLEKGGVSA